MTQAARKLCEDFEALRESDRSEFLAELLRRVALAPHELLRTMTSFPPLTPCLLTSIVASSSEFESTAAAAGGNHEPPRLKSRLKPFAARTEV
jgi:hypothetical protein